MKPSVQMLRETVEIGIGYVWSYVLMLVAAGTLVSLFTAWACAALFGVPFFDALAVMALAAAIVILWFVLKSGDLMGGWLGGLIAEIIEWSRSERDKMAAPQLPPPAPGVPVVTSGVAQPELIEGIDVRDLRYFCEQIVRLNDWTERRWMGVTLTNGYELSKGENGGYNRLIALFVKYQIITERTPRNTGKLMTDDVDAMMRALRNQAPLPHSQAPH